jgi:hypothetical protein
MLYDYEQVVSISRDEFTKLAARHNLDEYTKSDADDIAKIETSGFERGSIER